MKKSIVAVITSSMLLTPQVSAVENSRTLINQIEKDIECLALNIYFETRAVSLADAMAVSDVVLNRVNHTSFPNNIVNK